MSTPESAPLRESQRGARAFTGRERELSELALAWEEAKRRQGNLVLVVGPPGIGKTTLVERFFERVRAHGGEVHRGRCSEAQGTPPYWPWPELLRSYTERHGPSRVKALARADFVELASIAPTLLGRVAVPPSDITEGPYSAFRALDAVARFLRRATDHSALALVLEDVHLAEGAALDLIEHLQRSIAESNLLIVLTCRPGEAHERKQLRALLEGTLPRVRTLELGGLAKLEVARWIESAGGSVSSLELTERVTRTTDGHPLLIANLLRALPGGFSAADLEHLLTRELFIPENLGTTIRKDLERLEPETLDLVRTASVLGEEAWIPALAALRRTSPATLGPALDRALRTGIFERRESGRLRFTHALIRELLYRELDSAHRMELHAAAARAFANRLEDHPEFVIEAAHHAMAASPSVNVDETVELLVKAAGWARRRLAFELAAEHLRWALQTLDLGGPAPHKRAQLLLLFAQSLHLAGRVEDSLRTYRELYELSFAHAYQDRLTDALTGDFDIRVEATIADNDYQQRLLAALTLPNACEADYARLLAVRAVVTPFTARPDARAAWLDEAIRIGRRTDDVPTRLTTLHAASRVEFLDEGTACLELADEFKALAKSSGVAARVMDAMVWRSDCLLRLGRGAEFGDELLEVDQLGKTIGCGQFAYFPALYASSRKFLDGDLKGAESAARSAWEVGAPAVGILADALLAGQLLIIALELAGLERGRLLRDATERGDAVLAQLPAFETFRRIFAPAYLEIGRREVATGLLQSVSTDGATLKRVDRNWLVSMSMLIEAAIAEGDRAAASALREALAPHSGVQVSGAFGIGLRGPVSYWVGRLDLLLGDEEAILQFERGIAESERACSRTWKAWSELGLAEALSKRGSAGDLERARALRENVRRVATELDLPRLLSVVEGRVAF
jgi:hypothetical protein